MREDAVDLADPAVRAAWLAGVRTHVEDLAAAALDATEPPGRRELGRAAARRLVDDATSALREALGAVGA